MKGFTSTEETFRKSTGYVQEEGKLQEIQEAPG